MRPWTIQCNCEKLRRKCRKSRKTVGKLQPSSTLRRRHFWTASQRFFFASYNLVQRNYRLQLQEAALNITMELKHETKAADVVTQLVLTLGNSATRWE